MAAAGNSASDPCSFYYDEATTFAKILVGATDRNDAAAGFSNYGPCVHMQVFNAPSPVCACSPASGRPPSRYRTASLPLRVCAGPRFQHPGSVGRLKQHRHKHHQWHQHGGPACFRRRRPAAREGPDPLRDATQGDAHRRRGGGCHRPFCQRSSNANAQPLPHRRRRTRAVPGPPVTSAVPAYIATIAPLAAGASYGSHWPWLCAEPTGWALRAKQWVRWRGLRRQRGLHYHQPANGSDLGHVL